MDVQVYNLITGILENTADEEHKKTENDDYSKVEENENVKSREFLKTSDGQLIEFRILNNDEVDKTTVEANVDGGNEGEKTADDDTVEDDTVGKDMMENEETQLTDGEGKQDASVFGEGTKEKPVGNKKFCIQLSDSDFSIKHHVTKRKVSQTNTEPDFSLTLSFSDDKQTHTYSISQKGKLVGNNKVPFDETAKQCLVKLGDTSVTVIPSEKVPKCEFCDVVFANMHMLQSHRRWKCSKKPFQCQVCNQAFTQKDSLRRHKNLHTGHKPFKCNLCDEAFLYRTTLIIHKGVHEGKKGYKCDICEKEFARKCNLTLHMRLHTGEKPYACHVCVKKFIASTDLKRHVTKCHNDNHPFECAVCNEQFPLKSLLKKHFKNHVDNTVIVPAEVSGEAGKTILVWAN